MNATNFGKSPAKLIVMIIAIVVILHVLTAMALVIAKTPAPLMAPIEITPPIEIEMMTLPPPPTEIEEIVIEEVARVEPVKKVKTQSNAKPVAAAKPKIDEKPIDKPKAVIKKPAEPVIKENKPIVVKTKPTVTVKESNDQQLAKINKITAVDVDIATKELATQRLEVERQKILVAQANANAKATLEAEELRKAQALAKAQALTQAKADKVAQDKASSEASAAAQRQAVADAKAKEEAGKVAQAKASAASNETVSYGTIGNSSWLREPIFTSIRNKDYGFQGTDVSVSVKMSVDANGTIGNIKISKSSGDNKFDRDFIRALSKAKLHPATRDNVPTKSTAILPFRMNL